MRLYPWLYSSVDCLSWTIHHNQIALPSPVLAILTMARTIVIVLNKGASLVLRQGLVVPPSARWPSLHGGKLAVPSESCTYLRTAWRKILLCPLKSFHWFSGDGSRAKFTAQNCFFVIQNNQLVALMPQFPWAYWQHTDFVSPKQQTASSPDCESIPQVSAEKHFLPESDFRRTL